MNISKSKTVERAKLLSCSSSSSDDDETQKCSVQLNRKKRVIKKKRHSSGTGKTTETTASKTKKVPKTNTTKTTTVGKRRRSELSLTKKKTPNQKSHREENLPAILDLPLWISGRPEDGDCLEVLTDDSTSVLDFDSEMDTPLTLSEEFWLPTSYVPDGLSNEQPFPSDWNLLSDFVVDPV